MKKLIFLILITIFINCSINTNTSARNSYKYKIIKSFNYLIDNNLIDSTVVVSDTIKKIRTSTFSRFLYSEKSNLTKIKFTHLLRQQDISMNHKDYIYPINETLNNNIKEAKEIIYFSQARENYITVEVFDFKEKHARQPYFMGKSILYLFVFNKGSSIDKVYSEIIFYD